MSREVNAPRDKLGRYLPNDIKGKVKGFFSRFFRR